MNIVLQRKLKEREDQLAFIDQLLTRVDTEGRDLVDAEIANLEAAKQRCAELDAQIAPLEAYDRDVQTHIETVSRLPGPPAEPRRNGDGPRPVAGDNRGIDYRSAGGFLVDYLRARGLMNPGDSPDPTAVSRIQQARQPANQTTADTPGLLPVPIVGQVVSLIDANRPLISSLGGARPMGGIPGLKFTRPKVTQHTQVGKQTAEKTTLPTRKMTIVPIDFTKETWGGTVDVSRQDIDWTSPAAWDILVRDLAEVYSEQTETATAAAFKAAATGTPVVVDPDPDIALSAWVTALYLAAANSYAAGKRMPDRIWCSLDVWATLGALVDEKRVVFPPGAGAGNAELGTFRGDVLGLPRIVVPTFAAKTCIIGPSSLYEVYEQVIGLLSVIEPSILGVEVAYGGYLASGTMAATAFVPLTPPANMLEVAFGGDGDGPPEAETETAAETHRPSSSTSSSSAKK